MIGKIELTGAAETLLATLYARAVDARSAHPVLGDPVAAELLERIDYDFRRLKITRPTAIGVALRARYLDRWARAFLDDHPSATVVHLGCGLDSRVQRLDPAPGVRWFDGRPAAGDRAARTAVPAPRRVPHHRRLGDRP